MVDEADKDVYFKKTVTFNFSGQRLHFRVSQDLFSSHDVDVGTKFLLRTIVTSAHVGRPASILDLGCGYGPLGLTLKRLHERAVVHLTDRDALAVEYAAQNAALNRLTRGVEAYGSLGYDELRRAKFDLIVSNIPGKAGEPVIADLLLGAAEHLTADGLAAVVVVSPLDPLVARVLASRAAIEVILHEQRSGHAVFHYRRAGVPVAVSPAPQSALERGVYHRRSAVVTLPNVTYTLQSAYGLPEFETPSYAGELLIEALDRVRGSRVDRALAYNPGQGHAPVALWNLARPAAIDLVDRDLLALKYSALNLVENGCPEARVALLHQVGLSDRTARPADLVVGVVREEEGPKANATFLAQAATRLSPEGLVVVGGGSTAITRLAAVAQADGRLELTYRKRRRGASVLALTATRNRR
jgi:16S rRNA (guanine1207-N2)-methyltransferase